MGGETIHELKTREGQLVKITIPLDAKLTKEELQLFATSINKIEVATTKWIGGEYDRIERLSRYQLVPLCDQKGRLLFNGFAGPLEIVDAPKGRHGIVVHIGDEPTTYYSYGHVYTSSFYEFETRKQAVSAWQSARDENCIAWRALPGLIRRARCGPFEPWFYAIGNQAIKGDVVFPGEFDEWWIFSFGKKFVVHPDSSFWRGDQHTMNFAKIKTCWGTRIVEERSGGMLSGGENIISVRYALWSDGTLSRICPDNEKSLPSEIEILEGDSLLAHQALSGTAMVASGMKNLVEIICQDGSRVQIKWISADKKRNYKQAKYEVVFLTENGSKTPCQIEFTPGEKGFASLEEKVEKAVREGTKIITKWPSIEDVGSNFYDDFDVNKLDPKDPMIVEKFGISSVVKVLSITAKSRNVSGMKKWAGFFPEPREKSP